MKARDSVYTIIYADDCMLYYFKQKHKPNLAQMNIHSGIGGKFMKK